MATSPDVVRRGLRAVTRAAQAVLRGVVDEVPPEEPQTLRTALFAAAPLIVSDYSDGSAALALDWFEEIREDARPRRAFTPSPVRLVRDDDVTAMVARVSEPLYRYIEDDPADLPDDIPDLDQLVADTIRDIQAEVQLEIAAAFRDTITGNADDDPDAVGWQRFTRPGACKFCRALADRGAVYTRSSVKFAAHTDCSCLAGPSYDPSAPKASVIQYEASSRTRTAADRARLREYLNEAFPDAPG